MPASRPPSSTLQPLQSKLEMKYRAGAAAADRSIARTQANLPKPADILQRQRAVESKQLANHGELINQREASIARTRANLPKPADVLQRQRAVETKQLAQYADRLDKADVATGRARPRIFDARPQPRRPYVDSQPVNRLPRTRPTTLPANAIAPRLPNGIASRLGTATLKGIGPELGRATGILGLAPQPKSPQQLSAEDQLLNDLRKEVGLPGTLDRNKEWDKSPLNPFGKSGPWKDAPWNDPHAKRKTSAATPDGNGKIPILNPPTTPIYFEAKMTMTQYSHRGFENPPRDVYLGTSTYSTGRIRGIPVGFAVKSVTIGTNPPVPSLDYGFEVKDSQGIISHYTIIVTGAGPTPVLSNHGYATAALPQYLPEGNGGALTQTPTGEEFPGPDSGLEFLPPGFLDLDALSPQLSPQLEPTNDPAYRKFPQPDPYPQPIRRPNISPSRAPARAPSPGDFPQPQPIPQPEADPQAPPTTAPSPEPLPDGVPRPQPGAFPGAFPGLAPTPLPPPSANPGLGSIGFTRPLGATPQSPNVPQGELSPWKPINFGTGLVSQPGTSSATLDGLDKKLDKLSEEVEEKTRRGCKYKEDDLADCDIRVFKGNDLLTGAPEYETKRIQIHEKMTDFAQIQMQHLSEVRGQADGLRGRFKKVLDRLQIVRIMNLMSTVASLHNAAMLSRNLGQTLGDATSSIITAIGRVTGVMSPEESIDVNQLVGEAFNDLMKSALGEEVWTGTKASWNRANRILTAASSIVYSLRGMADSARSIAEFTANNTGRIGNALKKWGVVGENAYPWMSTNVTARTAFQAKMDKFREGVDSLDDAASSLSSVAGESISIQDEAIQIKEQWKTLDKSVKEAEGKIPPDNDPTKAAATAAKAVSPGKELDSVAIAISGED